METVELKVNNMKCMGCVNTVQSSLSKLLGVKNVEAFLDTKIVKVTYNGNPSVLDEIYRMLESVGFPATK
ncbi:MAG TPA: heavy metal-associated domain-containing protein [Tenuifilaceae bacterium]|nr:heavy metal-associated domain-containing protein [Tenuifilaceae bacterium]HPE18731.1 heavy metal-associated domain-containing protein [Tenuifilaceae bacterium]HPJ46375.1 heavy metal-associated domain-containing protein [Tenuifilaceae bacterium]HPQ34882.1 heavy metal-associated domain-containing protein [Tenuifilaceae bacterium]HRX68466.1 heavy metal-associated domain-containing protein [Tenuifilaceae bacterium]